MLQAFGLSYSPDPRVGPLFENVDFSLDPGEKVALVGRNGAGKSILLRILAGRLAASHGRVVRGAGDALGYLPQDFEQGFEGSLADLLELTSPDAPPHAVARALHRLRLDPSRLQQQYSSLSLGERMRGALAALLAAEPSILLLDEPTNHLDVSAREWLERFLSTCPEAVLIVCHDRTVINAVADRVVELERGGLTSYTGDFNAMVEAKQRRDARQQESWERHKQEDRRLRIAAEETLQVAAKMTRKPTGRTYDPKFKAFYAGKQARLDKRAKAIVSRVEKGREEAPEKPYVGDEVTLRFPTRPLRAAEALAGRRLKKSYGGRCLFDNLNVTLLRGSRIAVVGPNGAGKTTLFRLLLGEESPDAGEVVWASDAKVATLSQARDALNLELPAIRALEPESSEEDRFARTALARLGLRGEAADRPVGVLSVGERTKVEIVSMLLSSANVLLLDEPTNHLDLVSVQALESALMEFPGAILFTSHDRSFVERVATEVLELA
ncbi:ribosomal protection-like ABC-F family protein [Fimbriimonas ginsengisoli]|uniref:Putative ABC transporter ATP-binding protein n=1 Tax=Fimbriimonas ginsengisoli Gsoil 348 TaxID=661478 RepID=A0A068NRR7_FIMGI|nr:ABC-F family ATP-binding cassette domain-containing protein [Fimbriimonas ginsengisoli]AIE86243.1 putative ABC transporter ATP-binding protein [Fimbriimonas ginsengisoli Gsoil 348]